MDDIVQRHIPKDSVEIMPGLIRFVNPDGVTVLIWNWRSLSEASIDLEIENNHLRRQKKDLVLYSIKDYFLKVKAPPLGGPDSPLFQQEYENNVHAATKKHAAFHAFSFPHHTRFYKSIRKNTPTYVALDFGRYHPCAITIQSEADGANVHYHIHDVIRGNTEGTSLKAFLRSLKEILKMHYTDNLETVEWYTVQEGDTPSGTGITTEEGGATPVQVMWECGIHPQPRKYSRIQPRVDLVNEVLNRSIKGKPVLNFNPVCKDLTETMEGGYRREEIVRFGQTMPTIDFFKDGWYDHVADSFGGAFIVGRFDTRDEGVVKRLKPRKGKALRLL